MSNKNYIKGRNFEYKIKKILEKKSSVVFRTAGSHGDFDLIEITKHGDVNFYQLKNYSISKKEFDNLWNQICERYKMIPFYNLFLITKDNYKELI